MRPLSRMLSIAVVAFAGACAAPPPTGVSPMLRWSPDGLEILPNAVDLSVCPGTNVGSPHGPPVIWPPSLAISTAADGSGGAIMVWDACRDGDTYVHLQRVTAAGVLEWGGPGVTPCRVSWKQGGAVIAADGLGRAIVAWSEQRRYGDWDIYAQHVLGAGRLDPAWPREGRAVCTARGDQVEPVIVPDGERGAIVAWGDMRPGSSARTTAIYAQRLSAAGTTRWAQDGVRVCGPGRGKGSSALLTDGAGGAFVAWEDGRGGERESDIYIQRVSATGAPMWTGDGIALCTAAQGQHAPRIACDEAGGAIVAWLDHRAWGPRRRGAPRSQIFLQRIGGDGTLRWGTDGVPACAPARGTGWPAVVASGDAGVVVVWEYQRRAPGLDKSALEYGIVAQKLNASGAPFWSKDGIVCRAGSGHHGYIGYLRAVSDGAGGALVAWAERQGGDERVCAQHVSALGAVAWGRDSLGVTTALGGQWEPALCADGAGGAIVAWKDKRRPGSFGLYAQRIGDASPGQVTPRDTLGTALPGR